MPKFRLRTFIPLRRLTIFYLLLAVSLPQIGSSQAENPDQPFVISALPSVDENLFALRLLADIYTHWPDLKGDRPKLRAWFSEARRSTSLALGQIRTRGLDPDLAVVFNDCLSYMGATESYLSKLDLIDSQNDTRTVWDLITSLYDGYKASGDATSTASKLGFSDENAASAGKLVGAANAAANFYSKSQERGARYQTDVSDQARRLEDTWNMTWGTLQTVSRKLTAKYGWAVGEAGFDGFQSPQIADLVVRSPRDPFVRARYADSLLSDAKDPEQCIKATNEYLHAAQLVPSDSSYDSLRLQYVAEAMNAAVYAPAIEAGSRGYSAHPASAPVGLKLARTYLAIDPADTSGLGHVQLARSLAFLGRYDEAANQATTAYNLDKQWGDDAGFCYRYAKLMCLTGRMNMVADWLKQAYRAGYHDISSFRADPDMSGFRNAEPRQFEQLTAPKWGWEIKFGVFMDDVVVTNNSPFDLTNVQVQVHVIKGTQRWDPLIKCPLIRSGSSYKAENVMSVTGDSYDQATASLSSDQTSSI